MTVGKGCCTGVRQPLCVIVCLSEQFSLLKDMQQKSAEQSCADEFSGADGKHQIPKGIFDAVGIL